MRKKELNSLLFLSPFPRSVQHPPIPRHPFLSQCFLTKPPCYLFFPPVQYSLSSLPPELIQCSPNWPPCLWAFPTPALSTPPQGWPSSTALTVLGSVQTLQWAPTARSCRIKSGCSLAPVWRWHTFPAPRWSPLSLSLFESQTEFLATSVHTLSSALLHLCYFLFQFVLIVFYFQMFPQISPSHAAFPVRPSWWHQLERSISCSDLSGHFFLTPLLSPGAFTGRCDCLYTHPIPLPWRDLPLCIPTTVVHKNSIKFYEQMNTSIWPSMYFSQLSLRLTQFMVVSSAQSFPRTDSMTMHSYPSAPTIWLQFPQLLIENMSKR